MVMASLLAAMTAICAWIHIPIPPLSFTLQTLAVLLCLGLLGGTWGSVSIGLYLALGLVGLPVFSGFQGSAALAGPTAGFLWGFALAGLVYRLLEGVGRLPAMIGAQLIVYLSGCLWFSFYAGGIGFPAAAAVCVVPYLIPDAVKLLLAHSLTEKIRKNLRM